MDSSLESMRASDVVRLVYGMLSGAFPGYSVSLLCLVAAFILCYIPHVVRIVCLFVSRGFKSYDNNNPRSSYSRAASESDVWAGIISRTTGAHQNSLENWPFFAAGVLAAIVAGVPRAIVDETACLYVIIRAVYIALYLLGTTFLSYMRSVVFVAAVHVNLSLLWAAAKAHGAAK